MLSMQTNTVHANQHARNPVIKKLESRSFQNRKSKIENFFTVFGQSDRTNPLLFSYQ